MIISNKEREEYFNSMNQNSQEQVPIPSENSTVVVTPNYGDTIEEQIIGKEGFDGLTEVSIDYLSKVKNLKFSRADFKPEMFDRAIWQKGFTAIWKKATYCSCLDIKSNQPDYSCPYCYGKGYLYIDPKYTKVLVSSLSGKKEQDMMLGLEDKGSMYLTPLSIDTVGFRDKFIFPEFVVRFSELKTRGEHNIPYETLKYPVKQTLGIFIDGKEVPKDTYDIVDHVKVVWKDDTTIPLGRRYSILYLSNPVYIVLMPMHELRGTYLLRNGNGKDYFTRLPSQFQIKREDFLDVGTLSSTGI